jgi:hypothetical protein
VSRYDPESIRSEDVDDLEVGASVWSDTHCYLNGFPRGGTVLDVERDDDGSVVCVTTMEQQHGGGIDVFVIDRCDINMETVQWYGRGAAAAAEVINRWLGSKSAPRDKLLKLRWQRWALELAEAASSGQWLAGAEKRYQRAQALKRQGWAS